MKITYLTHACMMIEVGDTKIITDPWLVGPSWGGSLWHYPTHKFTPSNLPVPDIIFFSHGHDDHFHEETIKKFPKEWFKAKIIAPKYNVAWWEGELQKKFKKTFFLNHNESIFLDDGIELQIFLNDLKEFDCSLKIKSKNRCIFLQTDNLMSEKEAKRIAKIDPIDVAFVIPFLTGVFPGFYKWDSDTLIKLANEKISRSLNYCSKIVKSLNPKYVVPYACDVGYLGEKFHINLIHRHNKEDLIKMLKVKKIKSKPLILNPGDSIKLLKTIKIDIKNKTSLSRDESLIKFANEKFEEYQKYKINENKLTEPKIDKLSKIFIENLNRNLKKVKKFSFKTLINIQEENINKYILLNFKNRTVKEVKLASKDEDLKIEIESIKIRNLLSQKYPMNFMTFHNGGYTCERKVMNLSVNEKKYWSWINNLDFFI